jgi:hypothetical protein
VKGIIGRCAAHGGVGLAGELDTGGDQRALDFRRVAHGDRTGGGGALDNLTRELLLLDALGADRLRLCA